MKIDEILREFDLSFGEKGQCRMEVEGELMVVETSIDQKHCFLHAVVGEPKPEGRETLYKMVLSANLFGRGTGFASLAFDEAIESLVLVDRIPYADLSKDSFLRRLSSFTHFLKQWKKIVASPPAESNYSLEGHLFELEADQNLDIFIV